MKNGFLIFCGLITVLTLLVVVHQNDENEPAIDVDNDEDFCNDSDLTHYQQSCCYEVEKIAEECSTSHDPEQCRTERWSNSLCK